MTEVPGMQKRTTFTTVTPLPVGITRRLVLETLHDHTGMIDMAPQVINRKPIGRGPARASPEEFHAKWYEIQDRMSWFPGVKGTITYHVCFHDLADGVQSHVYAAAGLDIKDKWTLGGNEPGEPRQPQELGLNLPQDGLWLREDIDMRCNFMMASFVKAKLLKSHEVLVARLVAKQKIVETKEYNMRLQHQQTFSQYGGEGTYNSIQGAPSPGYPANHYPPDQKYEYKPQPQQPQPYSYAAELPSQGETKELAVDNDPGAYYRSGISKAASQGHHSNYAHHPQHRGSDQHTPQELPG